MTLRLRTGFAILLCLLVAACGPAVEPTAAPAPGATALVPSPDAAAGATPLDKVEAAMAQQRIYAPAGDNAIEHYLALRQERPGDASLATALLELLPYALIGSEQAAARGDFTEARRLVELVARVDPASPALPRLRDRIAMAEAEATARVIEEAEAAKRLALQAMAAEAPAGTPVPPAGAAATPASASPAPAPARIAAPTPAVAPAVAPAVSASLPALPVAEPAPASAASVATTARVPPAMPQLISAPTPRYPLMALRRKIEGEVIVAFTIQPDGSVAAPRVVSATPAGTFDEAALVAARRWKFQPTAASLETSRMVRFRLPGAGS